MGRRSQLTGPVCRVMTRGIDGAATFAVYGPDRTMVWLSVHTATPTVVRLWPRVVRFLRDTLDELADPSNPTTTWRLPWDTEHPEYVVVSAPDGHRGCTFSPPPECDSSDAGAGGVPAERPGRAANNGSRTCRPPPVNGDRHTSGRSMTTCETAVKASMDGLWPFQNCLCRWPGRRGYLDGAGRSSHWVGRGARAVALGCSAVAGRFARPVVAGEHDRQ
jgi:hypothetical protein